MKRHNYLVVKRDDLTSLAEDVTDYLNQGWELAGNLVIYQSVVNHYSVIYCQPLVKNL